MQANANLTLKLAPQDNVVIVTRSLPAGTWLMIGTHAVELTAPITLGHKLAAQPIGKGQKILKYNVPIGSATRDIMMGEHVHLHNMKSDYLPTYTRERGDQYGRP